MAQFFVWACAICMVAKLLWYIPQIVTGSVKPAPATWIIGCLMMGIGVASYSLTPGATVWSNITLYTSSAEITIVLLTLFLFQRRSVQFDYLQQFCLGVTILVLCYWYFNQHQTGVAYWSTQCLLIVAYIATIGKALELQKAFDSIGNWAFTLAASVAGSVPALISMDPQSIGNSIRAIVASGVTVWILIHFDRKQGWKRWRSELEVLCQWYKFW
jgi:hypothetical protein